MTTAARYRSRSSDSPVARTTRQRHTADCQFQDRIRHRIVDMTEVRTRGVELRSCGRGMASEQADRCGRDDDMAFMLKIRWDIKEGLEADFRANQETLSQVMLEHPGVISYHAEYPSPA